MRILLIISIILINMNNLQAQETLAYGHRGAMGHAPENTIASIKKALELGVDGIEIDVFKCKTGEIIVFHDKKINNLTNSKGYIEQKTLSEIRALKVNGKEPIPTLDEVLKYIDGTVNLNIELKGKNTSEGVFYIMKKAIENGRWKADQLFVSSFVWDELRDFKKLTTEFGIAVLTEKNPLDAIPVARELNAFAINPKHSHLTQEIINDIHSEGFEILTWTVNKKNRIEELISWKVDGIITDFPDRLKKKSNL